MNSSTLLYTLSAVVGCASFSCAGGILWHVLHNNGAHNAWLPLRLFLLITIGMMYFLESAGCMPYESITVLILRKIVGSLISFLLMVDHFWPIRCKE
jgi:hypothetical protein